MKIKLVNPNTTWAMTRAIEASGKARARPGTEIVAVSPQSGPASIESYYDEYLCIPGVLEEVRKADAEAILLGCAGFGEFADRLEAELEVPVFDGVAAAVKMVESLVELSKRTSKAKTYRAPEPKAFSGSFCHFGTG